MKFETLDDYDRELFSMKKTLSEMEEYIQEHPERIGYAGNYKTLKYVYNTYIQDRNKFIEESSNINLKLTGDSLYNGLTIPDLTNLSNKFNEAENSITNLLFEDIPEDLIIKSISQGSYNIIFAFKNPTEEDVKRTSPRKKGLLKIFNFIDCGDDIEKLKNEAGVNGEIALKKYKEFLKEIIKQNANFTLETENGALRACLTFEQCKNISENLNI